MCIRDSNSVYIGQTGRSFSSRYSEHLKAVSNNNIHSAFATHIHTQTKFHSYTNIDTNLEILHYLPKSRKLNTAEQYEIYKHCYKFRTFCIIQMCIRDSIRKHKCKIAYRTNNTIKKHINGTNKDIDKYNKTGVYKLNCNDCNSFYIGQMGRS